MSKSIRRRRAARLLLGLVLVFGLPLSGLAFYWLATFPDIARLAGSNPASTALMEARRAEAREQGRHVGTQWTWVPLSRISLHLQRAVIVSEDAAFYRHEGFDWEGIRQAAFRNIERGALSRGGSTITQQVAKNLYLSSERTLLRKAQEALITRALERHLTKKRILELYLNIAEWGRDLYGAEAAARHHFNKSAEALTAEEAALLAAMLPSPQQYDPLRLTPYLVKRRQQILKWMHN
jgi:monofunctional biosynthetic peptidoglycan transglycosylase